MRATLIILQAAALSLFAVLGAHGDPKEIPKCPVNTTVIEGKCKP